MSVPNQHFLSFADDRIGATYKKKVCYEAFVFAQSASRVEHGPGECIPPSCVRFQLAGQVDHPLLSVAPYISTVPHMNKKGGKDLWYTQAMQCDPQGWDLNLFVTVCRTAHDHLPVQQP